MKKEEILMELEMELKHFFCRGLSDAFKRKAMEMAVEKFIQERVSRYTEAELDKHFGEVEEASRVFLEYLVGEGLLDLKKGVNPWVPKS